MSEVALGRRLRTAKAVCGWWDWPLCLVLLLLLLLLRCSLLVLLLLLLLLRCSLSRCSLSGASHYVSCCCCCCCCCGSRRRCCCCSCYCCGARGSRGDDSQKDLSALGSALGLRFGVRLGVCLRVRLVQAFLLFAHRSLVATLNAFSVTHKPRGFYEEIVSENAPPRYSHIMTLHVTCWAH